jgi:phosphohistidine phosphatase
MKTMYLVRHGKSSWENQAQHDQERPLIEKGISRTRKIADYLAQKQVNPQLIISSVAVRAYETAKILAARFNYPEENIVREQAIYLNGASALENTVLSLDDNINEVMIIGHNPDMTNFANVFLTQKISYLPTTGVVGIRFDTLQWKEIFMSDWKTVLVITPRTLNN